MSAKRAAEAAQVVSPQQGDYAMDESDDPGRMGLVLLVTSRYVLMRELTSAEEWEAPPAKVRKLTAREELSARVAIANRRAQGVVSVTKDEARRAVGKRVEDLTTGRTGIVTAAEDWENPNTRRVAFTVFVRPEHGGTESYLSPANVRPVVRGS